MLAILPYKDEAEAIELANDTVYGLAAYVQGADRVATARVACEQHGAQLLILDDAFQHRRLFRDLDLVLVDALDPWGGGRLLPRGLLRELMTRHGIACDEIRGTRDPLFGGVNPEPIEPHVEALRRAVLAGKYDAGLCADGDGDRIGAMDRDGTFITPHQIFSILLCHWIYRASITL